MKCTVYELGEGPEVAVLAWASDLVDAAAELAHQHGIVLVGGATSTGRHSLPTLTPDGLQLKDVDDN